MDDNICGNCNGSGEGMYDGSTCSCCSGSGIERDYDAEYERKCEDADRYWNMVKERDNLKVIVDTREQRLKPVLEENTRLYMQLATVTKERDAYVSVTADMRKQLDELTIALANCANRNKQLQTAIAKVGADKAGEAVIDPNCTCDEHGACAYCWNGKKHDTAAPTPAQQHRQESEIAAEALTWQPIETAPKDGTLILLLLAENDELSNCIEGEEAHLPRTIGHNNFEKDGIDEWKFAGWNWDSDFYSEGLGTPAHWMPLPAAPKREAGK